MWGGESVGKHAAMEILRINHHSRWLHHVEKSKFKNMNRVHFEYHLVGEPSYSQVEADVNWGFEAAQLRF